jgi:hypothetical protein
MMSGIFSGIEEDIVEGELEREQVLKTLLQQWSTFR